MSFGVVDRLSIDDELVLMATVRQFNGNMPGTVNLALHRVCGGVPMIEVSGNEDRLGVSSDADEMDWFPGGLGSQALRREGCGSVPVHGKGNWMNVVLMRSMTFVDPPQRQESKMRALESRFHASWQGEAG